MAPNPPSGWIPRPRQPEENYLQSWSLDSFSSAYESNDLASMKSAPATSFLSNSTSAGEEPNPYEEIVFRAHSPDDFDRCVHVFTPFEELSHSDEHPAFRSFGPEGVEGKRNVLESPSGDMGCCEPDADADLETNASVPDTIGCRHVVLSGDVEGTELVGDIDTLAKTLAFECEAERLDIETLEQDTQETINKLEAKLAAKEKEIAESEALAAKLLQELRNQHIEKCDMIFSKMNEIDARRKKHRQEDEEKWGWLFGTCSGTSCLRNTHSVVM